MVVMAKEKKVNIKDIKKKEVIQAIQELFEDKGFDVNCGIDYGLTSSTLVVNFIECDIQIKVVSPSAKNGNRYSKIENN